MHHQGGNVFGARPQRRQQHGEDIQTIVEVVAKLSSIHHFGEIAIRGSHQPKIHLVSPGATQALELLFLQYPQQFRLQRRRNIAHLVQKKRAFVSQLETSNLLRYGSSECAFLVAKKFTFQEIQRNGSAVQSHERASATRTDVVNRVCDQLLACAGFSLDQHGGIGGRDPFDLFEHRFQSMTVPYDLLESALIRRLVNSPCYLDTRQSDPLAVRTPCFSSSAFQGCPNTVQQGFVVERLCQELHRSCSQRLHPHFLVAVRGEADGRNPATLSVQLGLQFQTGHSRHADICN